MVKARVRDRPESSPITGGGYGLEHIRKLVQRVAKSMLVDRFSVLAGWLGTHELVPAACHLSTAT